MYQNWLLKRITLWYVSEAVCHVHFWSSEMAAKRSLLASTTGNGMSQKRNTSSCRWIVFLQSKHDFRKKLETFFFYNCQTFFSESRSLFRLSIYWTAIHVQKNPNTQQKVIAAEGCVGCDMTFCFCCPEVGQLENFLQQMKEFGFKF